MIKLQMLEGIEVKATIIGLPISAKQQQQKCYNLQTMVLYLEVDVMSHTVLLMAMNVYYLTKWRLYFSGCVSKEMQDLQ